MTVSTTVTAVPTSVAPTRAQSFALLTVCTMAVHEAAGMAAVTAAWRRRRVALYPLLTLYAKHIPDILSEIW